MAWLCCKCGEEIGEGWADVGSGRVACAKCLEQDEELTKIADAIHKADMALVEAKFTKGG